MNGEQHFSSLSPRTPEAFVGRAAELHILQQSFATALNGQRQLVFIAGEPGIGKTTLVDVFLQSLQAELAELAGLGTLDTEVWLGHGQCVEHYGAGEAYLPFLEALSRLGRTPGGEEVVALLAQYAPTWLAQLPALMSLEEREALLRTLGGATRERMLREIAEALEILSSRRPFLLVLEDLHWCDPSTLDVLTYLFRRRGLARLVVLGTYRPADLLLNQHPLIQTVRDLHSRGDCLELRLPLLPESEVTSYVMSRCADIAVPADLPTAIYQRTAGNPLFMVTVVEQVMRSEAIAGATGDDGEQPALSLQVAEIPDSVRQVIGRQVERGSEQEQRILEAASVVGVEFVAAEVAAALHVDVETVEAQCERFARLEQFLNAVGISEWPDGTISGRYRFVHALYQNVLYERVPEARRILLHRYIGERKEVAYGTQTGEIAGELAAHFTVGRDLQRAVTYSIQAADIANHRYAHQEAVGHLSRGLDTLRSLPDTPVRIPQELELQVRLATSLMTLKGYAAAEVEQAYARAHVLCQQVEATPQLFPVLRGLVSFYQVRAQLQTAYELGEQLLQLCQHVDDPLLQVQAHYGHAATLYDLADFEACTAHLHRVLTLYTPQQHAAHVSVYGGYDPGVACLQWLARILWLQGYPTQAGQRSDEAVALAQKLGHPLSLAWALNIATVIHQYRGEDAAAHTCAQEALAVTQEYDLAFMSALAVILHGWNLLGQGQRETGIQKIQAGIAAYQSTGAALSFPSYLALLAGAHAHNGQIEEAQDYIAEALTLINKTGERWFEAEVYRIKGELLAGVKAEACFRKALEIARRQGAKSWELRAAMSLARLWKNQSKIDEVRALLEDVYAWFSEGFDTKDLKQAAKLLTELGGNVKKQVKAQNSKMTDPPSLTPNPQPLTPNTQLAPNFPSLFRAEGEYWTVAFAGEICRVEDSVGLRYLARLLQHPHEEFHAVVLVADNASDDASAHGKTTEADALTIGGLGDAGEVLDPQAKAAYRHRLRELQEEREDARQRADGERLASLQHEMDFLTRELSSAVGLGGRSRKAASASERARLNVTRALRRALQKIAIQHPALGDYLSRTIKTGHVCCYRPDSSHEVTWQF